MEDFSKYNGEGTTLRKVQLRVLEIFISVDQILNRNHIDYWLDCGALLGAVRHGGYIPWDDDIDICCKREDLDKIRDCLRKELPDGMIYVDWKNEKNFYDQCIRVKDTKGSRMTCDRYKYQEHKGVYLDILPVERIPSIRVKQIVEIFYGRVFRQVHGYGLVIYNSNFKRALVKGFSYIVYPFIYGCVSLIRLWSRIFKGDLMGYIYSINCTKIPTKRYISQIYPIGKIEFEGHMFNCPNDVHSYLTNLYGDYMKIPDEEHREMPYPVENI